MVSEEEKVRYRIKLAKLSPRKGSREVGNALMNQFIAKGRIVLMDNRTFFWKFSEEEKLGSRIRRRLSAN